MPDQPTANQDGQTQPPAGQPEAPTAPEVPQTPPADTGEPTIGGMPPVERLELFKKNLVFMWAESITLTGLPVDTLLTQAFKNASQMALPAQGQMIDFGMGAGFSPDGPSLQNWLDVYFQRMMQPTKPAEPSLPTQNLEV